MIRCPASGKKKSFDRISTDCIEPSQKDIETKASEVKFPANKAVTIKIKLPL